MVNTSVLLTHSNDDLQIKKNYRIEKASPDNFEKQSSNPSIKSWGHKKDERIPKMSKGSRRLNGLDLLPRKKQVSKIECNKNELDYDEMGYEIMYDTKSDEKMHSLSRTNSDSQSADNQNSLL
ncbi:unnamed protein product [Brachionus calyciflorus]|uniref:Uncharacterized protein n=1 Tax=Brachionus calyciflorus TaxID=104777 RepID=A0A813R2H8_9BILA|nr:unnamed protein product [Brachionus calyciflorus]